MAATREDVPTQLYNDRNCEVTATQQSNLRPAQWKYLTEPRAESISNKQREKGATITKNKIMTTTIFNRRDNHKQDDHLIIQMMEQHTNILTPYCFHQQVAQN